MVTTRLQGFSLIEVIIALSIFAIAGSVAFGFDLGNFRRENFTEESDTLLSTLETARSEAMHDKTDETIYFQTHSYTYNRVNYSLNTDAYFSATGSITFAAFSGNASDTSFTLTDAQHHRTFISNSEGQISWSD